MDALKQFLQKAGFASTLPCRHRSIVRADRHGQGTRLLLGDWQEDQRFVLMKALTKSHAILICITYCLG